MSAAALVTPEVPEVAVSPPVRHGEYRCPCGHRFRVFGGGRHRIYFEADSMRLNDPIMDGLCPQCGRGLPGKQ